MGNRWENIGNSDRLYFGGLQKSLKLVIAAMKLKDACSLEEKAMINLDSILKSRDITREGNGNALQYSCLENPMEGEAW